jgi:membrane protease YdiL (CAAX protease family)
MTAENDSPLADPQPGQPQIEIAHQAPIAPEPSQQFPPAPEPAETRFLKSILFGPDGVRTGWMVLLFFILTAIVGIAASAILQLFYTQKPGELTAGSTILQEAVSVLAILIAAKVCALIERRRVVDYYLSGRKRIIHFVVGSLAGFAALSALVGTLYEGHWLQFSAHALSGSAIFSFAALWAIGFLGTGLAEEGTFRCYMLFTLTRGINYWWALGTVLTFCIFCFINPHANGVGGVYLMAGLGVVPCLMLHLRQSPSAGFWQAAWLTSTLFGYIHTGNHGETWIGIFAAAAIGFVFCVSIRLTGSAWWAIGFHAVWDWAQTYFYGTPDSGFQPNGHYLTSNPTGPVLWSGGTAGPEGSILVLAVILLTLLALIAVYGRRKPILEPIQTLPQSSPSQIAG